jgi:hypothetical protein
MLAPKWWLDLSPNERVVKATRFGTVLHRAGPLFPESWFCRLFPQSWLYRFHRIGDKLKP